MCFVLLFLPLRSLSSLTLPCLQSPILRRCSRKTRLPSQASSLINYYQTFSFTFNLKDPFSRTCTGIHNILNHFPYLTYLTKTNPLREMDESMTEYRLLLHFINIINKLYCQYTITIIFILLSLSLKEYTLSELENGVRELVRDTISVSVYTTTEPVFVSRTNLFGAA